jgi:hypothetical protein
MPLVYQLVTFQGIRFGLFAYANGRPGGEAVFTEFVLDEVVQDRCPKAVRGVLKLMDQPTYLRSLEDRAVFESMTGNPLDLELLGEGEIRLVDSESGQALTVFEDGSAGFLPLDEHQVGQRFMWEVIPRGDVLLLSLFNHRYLQMTESGHVGCSAKGPEFSRANRASFEWIPLER